MANVRAKFRVSSVGPNNQVKLEAVTADEVEEKQRFHKYTPNGTLTMWIDNPPALEFFTHGKTVYLDFSEAT